MIFHIARVLIIGQISRIIRVGGISSAKLRFFLQIRKFWCIFAKYLKKVKNVVVNRTGGASNG